MKIVVLRWIAFLLVIQVVGTFIGRKLAEKKRHKKLTEFLAQKINSIETYPIQEIDLASCPTVVSRYLRKAGVLGKSKVQIVHFFHSGKMRTSVESKW